MDKRFEGGGRGSGSHHIQLIQSTNSTVNQRGRVIGPLSDEPLA